MYIITLLRIRHFHKKVLLVIECENHGVSVECIEQCMADIINAFVNDVMIAIGSDNMRYLCKKI